MLACRANELAWCCEEERAIKKQTQELHEVVNALGGQGVATEDGVWIFGGVDLSRDQLVEESHCTPLRLEDIEGRLGEFLEAINLTDGGSIV